MRFQTIMMKQRIGDSGRCVQYIQIVYVCVCVREVIVTILLKKYLHLPMQCWVIILLEVVTSPHKSEWMRVGSHMNPGEKPVVLGEQRKDMHSP